MTRDNSVDRRTFLGVLAAVPFVGWAMGRKVKAAPPTVIYEREWVGGGNVADFNDPGNWTPWGAPKPGETLVFGRSIPRVKELRSRAFTIIELLVVVSFIALLIGLLLPALSGARGLARNARCLAQLRTLATAVSNYRMECGQLVMLVPDYIDVNSGATTCPADPQKRQWSYVWIVGLGEQRPVQMDANADADGWSKFILLGDQVDFRHGRSPWSWSNAGYLDGHAGTNGPDSDALMLMFPGVPG